MKPYYEQDGITIYHGDCREVLPTLGPVDVLVTDPPYGISHASNREDSAWRDESIENDGDTSIRDWLLGFWGDRPGIVFGTWKAPRPASIRDWLLGFWGDRPGIVFGTWKAPRPAGVRAVLVWDKGPASGMGDLAFPWKNSHEEIYVLGTGFAGYRGESVLKGHSVVTWASKGRCHPNEKPVSLLRDLVGKCPGETILDPFMGSGTTLRAAKDLGRKAIGIEISERWCEVAARRLEQAVLPLSFEKVQEGERFANVAMFEDVAAPADSFEVGR